MRASFILTHRPGRKFSFMDYILASMDDDCAKVSALFLISHLPFLALLSACIPRLQGGPAVPFHTVPTNGSLLSAMEHVLKLQLRYDHLGQDCLERVDTAQNAF